MLDFYKGKKIFITGHTGFKGSWLCRLLFLIGAEVYGYALDPPEEDNLFSVAEIKSKITSITGDIRDREYLINIFEKVRPEIVIHMAAQPIVRTSYMEPANTYEVNVIGTVNICEAIRLCPGVKSFLNVTTDKVYKNNELERGYREDDELDGFDPYSNSKSCSELVTHCYINSYFKEMGIAVSTARAGNVIGGGDFAKDRIIPDCVRAASKKEDIIIRNPNSVRMYQHVLEPLTAYLTILKEQYKNVNLAGFYNVGPKEEDAVTTGELATIFCEEWGYGEDCSKIIKWVSESGVKAPHEAGLLRLDCSKLSNVFGWRPKWTVREAVSKTVEWSKVYFSNGDSAGCMDRQIMDYYESGRK